jgi:hypothetical protein
MLFQRKHYNHRRQRTDNQTSPLKFDSPIELVTLGPTDIFNKMARVGVLGVEIKGNDWANEETLISDHNSIGNLYGRRIFQQRLKIIISSSPLKTKF